MPLWVTPVSVLVAGFLSPSFGNDPKLKTAFFTPILCLAIVFALWCLFGRDESADEPTVGAVDFYPPEQCNSLDAQYYYCGEVDENGVVSLLFYLAGKGYLKIIKHPGTAEKFTIQKLKSYNGRDYNEQKFMKALFAKGDTIESDQAGRRLSGIVDKIMHDVNNQTKEGGPALIKPRKVTRLIARLFLWATLLVPVGLMGIMDTGTTIVLAALFIPAFAVGFLFWGLVDALATLYRKAQGLESVIMAFVFILAFSALSMGLLAPLLIIPFSEMPESVLRDPSHQLVFVAIPVCMALEGILIFLMPQRTAHGAKNYNDLKRFRTFLRRSKNDYFERSLKTDPGYFYTVLPFAFVLGVPERWYKKFLSNGRSFPSSAGYEGIFSRNSDDGQILWRLLNAIAYDCCPPFTSTDSDDNSADSDDDSADFDDSTDSFTDLDNNGNAQP